VAARGAIREPNFFLVGASRAGTTSLWRYLVEHPDVFMPRRSGAEKEPCFFCELTPRWATAFRDRDRYLALFAEAGDRQAVGEASTPYLVAPEVPARIRAAYPNARIIIVLRNPADRAFSLYCFLCAIGGEWVPSFERALAIEPARMADETFRRANPLWYALFEYFHSGLYAAQVARYLDTFPREQVHVVLFDDLRADPLKTARQVYRFLGVDPAFEPRAARYNASRFPLSVRLQYLVAHDMDRSAPERMGAVRKWLFRTNVRLGHLRQRPFHPRTRARLLEAYRDDIARTGALINQSLESWTNPDALAGS
jgi:Sulfotransferase domain